MGPAAGGVATPGTGVNKQTTETEKHRHTQTELDTRQTTQTVGPDRRQADKNWRPDKRQSHRKDLYNRQTTETQTRVIHQTQTETKLDTRQTTEADKAVHQKDERGRQRIVHQTDRDCGKADRQETHMGGRPKPGRWA